MIEGAKGGRANEEGAKTSPPPAEAGRKPLGTRDAARSPRHVKGRMIPKRSEVNPAAYAELLNRPGRALIGAEHRGRDVTHCPPLCRGLVQAAGADAAALKDQAALAQLASDEQLLWQFADDPSRSCAERRSSIWSPALQAAAVGVSSPDAKVGKPVGTRDRSTAALAALPGDQAGCAVTARWSTSAQSGLSDAITAPSSPSTPPQLNEVAGGWRRASRASSPSTSSHHRADRRHPRGGRRRGARHPGQGPLGTDERSP